MSSLPSMTLLPLTPEQLAQIIEEASERGAAKALAARESDAWLSAKPAARYLYGEEGKEEAFRGLRTRHPELDSVSVGQGRMRRWRRNDLDTFLASHPRLARRQQAASRNERSRR